jgi:general secretion pathway protein G
MRRHAGLHLVEVALAMAVLAVTAAIGVPSYSAYLERSRLAQARSDIAAIDQAIARFEISNGSALPETLDQAGIVSLDPWGRPYRYLNLRNAANIGQARKDHNLVPINTDFDLYSLGADGRTAAPLTAAHSRDDIIRARNGRFVGKATDF